MRIDLTIRCRDGVDHDIAITAADHSRVSSMAAALAAALPCADPAWSGTRPVRPESVLGGPELRTGARLTAHPASGSAVARSGLRLELVGGLRAGTGIPLRGGTATVGRARGCDVPIDDPLVSRRHAVFTVGRSGITVRDADSTHGTSVDGCRTIGDQPVAAGSIVRIGETFLAARSADEPTASARPGPEGTILVSRNVAVAGQPEHRVLDVPEPPVPARPPRQSWAVTVAPAIAGVVLAVVLHSAQFLAFALLGPLGLMASAMSERLGSRRRVKGKLASYRVRMLKHQEELDSALKAELEARRSAQPDPAAILRTAQAPGARLWRRSRGDPDLLHLRVGLADVPSAVQLRHGRVAESATTLISVPAIVDIGSAAVGLIGPRRVREALARWLIGQLAVLCSPADVELALLIPHGTTWSWTRWLPHLRARIACTPAEHDVAVGELIELARTRITQRARQPPTWLIVLIDGPGAIAASSRLWPLLTDTEQIGLTALFVADRDAQLPGYAQVVRVEGETGGTVRLGDAVIVADGVAERWADDLARALAPLRDAEADPAAILPGACRLATLFGDDPPTPTAILGRWNRCDNAVQAVLGVDAEGRFAVDLDRDGPHMLIAGTTGSGKSELLQSLVVGLAAQHPPNEVTFLLIDYKGGSAFAGCAALPHVVGVVTDLDDHLVGRVLTSLDSEIRRREAVLAAAAVRDRASLRAAGGSMPRLVLVVDEFAALASELSGFVPGLVGIAQRGRSLGLHLVLATQRPAGVVSPEIRANVAIRVALRMTSAADSVDVIDTADAAAIDRRTPGRAYVRISNDVHLVQCARVSGLPATSRTGVALLDEWRRLPPDPTGEGGETDLAHYVDAICSAASGLPKPARPWLPPLPTVLTVADLPHHDGPGVPIGRVDLPREQRQAALTLDLDAGGAVLIAGSSRSGRSSALLAIALAAAHRRPSHALELHAIDSTASALGTLALLPHLGTLADRTGGFDLAARLLARLETELVRRRDSLTAGNTEPALLVLVDGWEALAAAAEQHDGGRTVERLLGLMRDAPAAGATVVVAGGRATLSARIAATVATRFVLHQHEASDYAQAGVDPRTVRQPLPPGRAIRVGDGAEAQFAFPGSADEQRRTALACAARWPGEPGPRLRLRQLPRTVRLAELPASHGWLLGVGGDAAAPITLELSSGAGRVLVAGAPRSGRSTVLCSLLAQTDQRHAVLAAAPARSPLARAARERNLTVFDPGDEPVELPAQALLLVDDSEAFTDTPIGEALVAWLRHDAPGRIAVVAGRSDVTAISFRGVAAEVRQARCGVLLQPGPIDGELLGLNLPRNRAPTVAGRGLLVPDPAWLLGEAPIPIQVALA